MANYKIKLDGRSTLLTKFKERVQSDNESSPLSQIEHAAHRSGGTVDIKNTEAQVVRHLEVNVHDVEDEQEARDVVTKALKSLAQSEGLEKQLSQISY